MKNSQSDTRLNWDDWIRSLENIEGITKEEKTQASNAISYIRSLLGSALDGTHPIFQGIYQNRAPWTIKWLIELVDTIQLISGKKHGNLILKKFTRKETFDESLFQLYIERVLLKGNFEVEFIKENNDKKTPDIRVIHSKSGKQLHLELTEIEKSFQERQNEESYQELIDTVRIGSMVNYETKLYYRGVIHRYLSSKVRKTLIPRIQKKISQTYKKGLSSLKSAGKIELVIADDVNYSKLETWAKRNDIFREDNAESKYSSIKIPDPQPDKPFRIGNKIRKERLQFDKSTPNGLVIKFDNLFDKKNIKNVMSLVEDLEQYVYDFEDLDILIIIDNQLGGFYKDAIYSKNGNLYLIQNIFPIQKQILVIVNIYSSKREDAKIFLKNIKKAFQFSNTLLF